MKISNILWLSMAVAAPAYGQAGMFGLWGSDNKKEEAAPVITNKTIHDKIHDERRYVLFNSRRLSGECLDVCVPDSRTDDEVPADTRAPTPSPTGAPTNSPTGSPTSSPTGAPTSSPTGAPTSSPTGAPTSSPTGAPTSSPTGAPTASPTDSPTKSPSASPTDLPDPAPPADCSCKAGMDTVLSWKCGNDLYICPELTKICAQSPSEKSIYYKLTPAQCDAMKTVELNTKCVPLEQYGLTHTKELSHRVCYDGDNLPLKEEKNVDGCDECKGFEDVVFEETPSPVQAPTPVGGSDCVDLVNLGDGLSAATPPYPGCYPHISSNLPNNLPKDSSVNVFAGGDFIGVGAAEVEGNVVVLGDLIVESAGPGNFGSVGAGSQIYPPNESECIRVGGNIKAYRDIQVHNHRSYMKCDIVYKGTRKNGNKWKTNGRLYKNANLDLSFYEKMKYVLEKKSKYWATLPETGTIETADGGETIFKCSNKNEVQVFNFTPDKHHLLETSSDFSWSPECVDKTILINVLKGGNIGITAATMNDYDGGKGHSGFSTCLTSSILWNVPFADNVDIGFGKKSEFHGSVLTTGNMKLTTTGLSGRAMVLGNIEHGPCGGSEFHAYQFNPPIALPDPDDICVIPDNVRAAYGSVAAYPTVPPTPAPTNDPNKCLAESNDIGVTDAHCATCPEGVTTWPCDLNPPVCVGKCEKTLDPNGCQAKPNGSGITDEHCKQCVGPKAVTWWPCGLGVCVGKKCKT